MVITGSKIDFLGSGGREKVEQSWRNAKLTTLRSDTGKKLGNIGNLMYDAGHITMNYYSDCYDVRRYKIETAIYVRALVKR